jgi:hypothetical protein
MYRSQLKRKINSVMVKYGNDNKYLRWNMVNMIMELIDLYYAKAKIKYNERKLKENENH